MAMMETDCHDRGAMPETWNQIEAMTTVVYWQITGNQIEAMMVMAGCHSWYPVVTPFLAIPGHIQGHLHIE